MKGLVIFVIFLTQYQIADSLQLADLLTVKFYQVLNSITDTFQNIGERIKSFFYKKVVHAIRETDSLDLYNNKKNKIKTAFSDFIEEVAAETETESWEHDSLKSEPTALMSTPQLATLHGRRVESHVINTADGYLITIHRVLRPVNLTNTTLNDETVLLYHGLLGSSADWILLGPNNSLPYLLSNAGCDVWMANARGNYYSRGHVSKKIESNAFWKFTWQEMGEYDLPAIIKYIKKYTSEPINFIGHSMGASVLLVMLSTLPHYNQYLKIGILLAPLAFMTNVEGPMKILAHMSTNPPEQLLKLIGHKEFLPSRKVPKFLTKKYCRGSEILCSNPLLFLSGLPVNDNWNTSFTARVLYHIPAGGSTNTLLHYAQLAKNGKFHRYNDVSSQFDLNSVTLPIAILSSTDDLLATVPDVLRLYFSILTPIDHYIIRGRNLSHTDFILGSDAPVLIYKKIIEYLENGLHFNNATKINEV